MTKGPQTKLIFIFIAVLLVVRFATTQAGIYHFQPYIALFFCLAATKKSPWLIIPLAAYVLSTMLAVGGFPLWMLSPLLAYSLIVVFGKSCAKLRNPYALIGAAGGGAAIFHFSTNTISWLSSGRYFLNFQGWIQSVWTGLPGDPLPSWAFLRNDMVSTLLYTAIYLVLVRAPKREKEAELVGATLKASK